jgi:hypothetical protein
LHIAARGMHGPDLPAKAQGLTLAHHFLRRGAAKHRNMTRRKKSAQARATRLRNYRHA